MEKKFTLAQQAHIATQSNKGAQIEANAEDFSLIVRQISIDKLAEENKRLNPNNKVLTKIDKNPNEALC